MDPTLNDIRKEIADERQVAAEKARLEHKTYLLKMLASASEALNKEIDDLKSRRDALKDLRKAVNAVANDENLTAEQISETLAQVNAVRKLETVNFRVTVDPSVGGLVKFANDRVFS